MVHIKDTQDMNTAVSLYLCSLFPPPAPPRTSNGGIFAVSLPPPPPPPPGYMGLSGHFGI